MLFGISTDMCGSTTARRRRIWAIARSWWGDACFCFDQPDADGRALSVGTLRRPHLATLRAEFAQVVDTGRCSPR